MSSDVAQYRAQVDAITGEAFEQKFKRFTRFQNKDGVIPTTFEGIGLEEAQQYLRELAELRTWLTGRKSALSALKKVIGKLPPEDRPDFAYYLGVSENGPLNKIAEVERNLSMFIDRLQTERER